MFFLFLFAVFIEDTVYVKASFPYAEELKFDFPAFSQVIALNGNPESILNESGSILLKQYGNLSSFSIRGTRTQDIDIELNGIPLKTVQNDYVDVSILPSSLNYKGIVVKHPLSSYGSISSPGGGIFLNMEPVQGAGLGIFSDRILEMFLNWRIMGSWLWVSMSRKNTEEADDFTRLLLLFSGKDASVLFATRNAGTPGPSGTLIKGRKNEILAGYSLSLFNSKPVRAMLRGNISSLSYKDAATSDRHKSFYNTLSLQNNFAAFSFITEYISSSKAGCRKRNTISLMFKKDVSLGDFLTVLNASIFYVDKYGKTFGTVFLGLSKRFNGIVVYSNYSKGVHLPSFFDLYWPEDAFAKGNTELLPEYIVQYEAGAKYLKSHTTLYLTLFNRKVENMIQWIPVEGKYSPFNTGSHGLYGIEGKIEYQDSKISAGFNGSICFFDEILYYPHIEEGFYLKAGGFRLGVFYVGKRQKRPGSIKSLPPMEIIDLNYERRFVKNVIFDIGIKNLLDESEEWIAGYPQGGRVFYTKIRVKWR